MPEIFVIGDLASLNGADGKPLPGVAQVAIQMGRHAARNIGLAIEGKPYQPFTTGTSATWPPSAGHRPLPISGGFA